MTNKQLKFIMLFLLGAIVALMLLSVMSCKQNPSHTCSIRKDGVKPVRLDLRNGAAFFFVEDEWHWFPIYKSCCSFYKDKELKRKIQTKAIKPKLILKAPYKFKRIA